MVLETFVDGNGNLPEGYGPGVDMLECKMILGFDSYPQVADRLVLCNPDREGIVGALGSSPKIQHRSMMSSDIMLIEVS
jgi:hypothetical protein